MCAVKYSCEFINPATDERVSVIAHLTDAEIGSVERLRAGHGNADLFARAYALRHAYTKVPKGFLHLRGSERQLRTGEYVEMFLKEMRADARFASGADAISEALDAIDREADGNADAAAFFECVRYVLERPKPIAEKLDVLRRLMELQGRVTVHMQLFTGWK
jgi:hypothetical protein